MKPTFPWDGKIRHLNSTCRSLGYGHEHFIPGVKRAAQKIRERFLLDEVFEQVFVLIHQRVVQLVAVHAGNE